MSALPTEVRRVLPDLVREVRDAVGDRLVGVYLYGSAVGEGFDGGEETDADVLLRRHLRRDHGASGSRRQISR
ncbi:hypothetical protein ACIPC1_34710 [Streptomyces sp. NPDC087263]|uniref:hypothetical protein n=1 Tax=Streptomyces sp. NPDC087263 TaxID=3365773 RepID=UPI003804FB24